MDDRFVRKILGDNLQIATLRVFLIWGLVSAVAGTLAWLIG